MPDANGFQILILVLDFLCLAVQGSGLVPICRAGEMGIYKKSGLRRAGGDL